MQTSHLSDSPSVHSPEKVEIQIKSNHDRFVRAKTKLDNKLDDDNVFLSKGVRNAIAGYIKNYDSDSDQEDSRFGTTKLVTVAGLSRK